MKLIRKYEKKEDIPKGLEDLYIEDNGVFTLDGVEGMDIFAMDKQIAEQKALVEERDKQIEATIAERDKNAADYEALKKEKGSKDNAVEMAELRRKLESTEAEKSQIQQTLEQTNQKITLNEIRKSLTPAVEKLVIDNADARNDILNQLEKQFTLTDSGHVVTKDDLGEQALMKPEDYLTHYLKTRSFLSKSDNQDQINNKSTFTRSNGQHQPNVEVAEIGASLEGKFSS